MNTSNTVSLRHYLDVQLASEKAKYEEFWGGLQRNLAVLDRVTKWASKDAGVKFGQLCISLGIFSWLLFLVAMFFDEDEGGILGVILWIVISVLGFFIFIPIFLIEGVVFAISLVLATLTVLAAAQALAWPVRTYCRWKLRSWNRSAFGTEWAEQIDEIDANLTLITEVQESVAEACRELNLDLSIDYFERVRIELLRVSPEIVSSFENFERLVKSTLEDAERDRLNLTKAVAGQAKLISAFKQANHEAQRSQNDAVIDFAGDLQIAIGNLKGYLEQRTYEKYFSLLKYLYEQCRLLFENARRAQTAGAGSRQSEQDGGNGGEQPQTEQDDPYVILGVARDASRDAIRSARRKLLTDLHPDRVRNTTAAIYTLVEEEAKRINAAFVQIESERKRAGTW